MSQAIRELATAAPVATDEVEFLDKSDTAMNAAGTNKRAAWSAVLAISHAQAWSTITSTPTTLAGYGITDAITAAAVASGYQPLDADLTALATLFNSATGTLTGSVTGNAGGSSGSCAGNAATATALQTGRAINGVTFDGTAAITVTAAAGTLSGSTLAAGVTASSLTSVGTLVGGATGAGFTVALGASTVTGTLAKANGGTGEDNSTGGTANTFWGRPNGAAGAAAYRAIVAADVPTLNQSTTGSAATLTTARGIYGNNFDGSAALTQVIASTYGGTGNGFTKFSGPASAEKTFTLPNADATILYSGGALGTPSGGTLTNCAGLPVGGISATGTPSSATYLRGDGTWDTPAGGGGGVSDGDKGDVTVSSSGATWTIDSGVITLAKQADLATQRVIGRNTGSTGTPEAVTASQVLDWVGSTRGSMVYRGSSSWAALAPGTSGHVLTSAGSGADPAYAALPTASSGESVLGSDFLLTSTGSFQDTGLSVSLPAAGTYLLVSTARITLIMSAGTGYAVSKLYNSTAGADVSNSERLFLLTTGHSQLSVGMGWVVTVGAASTIKMYCGRFDGGSASFSASQLSSDNNGRTNLAYVRLA